MAFFLIKGTFHVKGYSPDGDSIRFRARNPDNWKKLSGPAAELNARGHAQLRVEGVDALETHYQGYHQPMKLALTGVALSACWASLTDYLMLLHPQDVNSALLWLTGSLWGRDWHFVKIAVPLLILFLPLSLRFCRDLDLLALGDARAATLGVSVQRTRFQGLMLAVAMTATGVAVCGPISFIGLVVPHMVRRIAGGRHRWLMPVSALTGALLLVIADLLARIIHPPLELPAGVLTAIIGAPWFVWLLVRMR